MRPVRYKKLLFLVLFLVVFFALAPLFAKTFSINVAWLSAPLWRSSRGVTAFVSGKECKIEERVEQLEAENYLLRAELARLNNEKIPTLFDKAIRANVIYRDPTSWNSILWVNVGEQSNEKIGERVIAKNSCVLVGKAIVGIVDYVGKKESRVRLLTDRTLHPAVRSSRGELKNQAMLEHLDVVLTGLSYNKEYTAFFERIKKRLVEEKGTLYLAKGYLQGAGAPLWRKRGAQLLGSGFNYDFADKQGAAKRIDLGNPNALLQEGDLLVTTGMDGIFPPDLFVAFVTKVYPLKEGDVSYKIEAKPYIPNLDRLKSCTILPPREFNFNIS